MVITHSLSPPSKRGGGGEGLQPLYTTDFSWKQYKTNFLMNRVLQML